MTTCFERVSFLSRDRFKSCVRLLSGVHFSSGERLLSRGRFLSRVRFFHTHGLCHAYFFCHAYVYELFSFILTERNEIGATIFSFLISRKYFITQTFFVKRSFFLDHFDRKAYLLKTTGKWNQRDFLSFFFIKNLILSMNDF